MSFGERPDASREKGEISYVFPESFFCYFRVILLNFKEISKNKHKIYLDKYCQGCHKLYCRYKFRNKSFDINKRKKEIIYMKEKKNLHNESRHPSVLEIN